MFSSDDSITSSHAHFFELKMGVSAVCVYVHMCVHCWWIKTTVADGVSKWEAEREETGSSHSFVFLSSFLPKNASVSLLLSHTNIHRSHSFSEVNYNSSTNTHQTLTLMHC